MCSSRLNLLHRVELQYPLKNQLWNHGFCEFGCLGNLKCYARGLQTHFHIEIFCHVCNWKLTATKVHIHPVKFNSEYLNITTTCIMHYSSHVPNHNTHYFILFCSFWHGPSPTHQVHSTVSYFNYSSLRKCHVVLEEKVLTSQHFYSLVIITTVSWFGTLGFDRCVGQSLSSSIHHLPILVDLFPSWPPRLKIREKREKNHQNFCLQWKMFHAEHAENNLHKKGTHIPPESIIWIMNKYIVRIHDVIWFYKIEGLFLKNKKSLTRKNGFLFSKALMDGKIIFLMYWQNTKMNFGCRTLFLIPTHCYCD